MNVKALLMVLVSLLFQSQFLWAMSCNSFLAPEYDLPLASDITFGQVWVDNEVNPFNDFLETSDISMADLQKEIETINARTSGPSDVRIMLPGKKLVFTKWVQLEIDGLPKSEIDIKNPPKTFIGLTNEGLLYFLIKRLNDFDSTAIRIYSQRPLIDFKVSSANKLIVLDEMGDAFAFSRVQFDIEFENLRSLRTRTMRYLKKFSRDAAICVTCSIGSMAALSLGDTSLEFLNYIDEKSKIWLTMSLGTSFITAFLPEAGKQSVSGYGENYETSGLLKIDEGFNFEDPKWFQRPEIVALTGAKPEALNLFMPNVQL